MILENVIGEFANTDYILPAAALREALDRWDEYSPRFVELLEQCANGADRSKETKAALFYIIHLFGEKREAGAFPTLCRLLQNGELSDSILRDAITENLRGILIACWNGDLRPLKTLIECATAGEFTRGAALEALAYLSRSGASTDDEMRAYLVHLRRHMLPRGDCFVWVEWAMVAANLGYADFESEVKKLLARGWIEFRSIAIEDFRGQLGLVLADPSGMAGFKHDRIGPFTDTIGTLSHWHCFSDAYKREQTRVSAREMHTPEEVIAEELSLRTSEWRAPDTFRTPGRNEPCMCGSGKKYKKCCLR